MKILFMIGFTLSAMVICAQTPGEHLAEKVAKKMKDTLSLTEAQKGEIHAINLQLYTQKQMVFQKYTSAADSLRFYIQRIENTRDTLYSTVLSQEKYIVYKQKKILLLFDN
jgi:hypothetical protein